MSTRMETRAARRRQPEGNRRNGKGLFRHALPGPVRKKNPERALSGGGKEGSHAFGTENDRKQGIFSLDRGEKR